MLRGVMIWSIGSGSERMKIIPHKVREMSEIPVHALLHRYFCRISFSVNVSFLLTSGKTGSPAHNKSAVQSLSICGRIMRIISFSLILPGFLENRKALPEYFRAYVIGDLILAFRRTAGRFRIIKTYRLSVHYLNVCDFRQIALAVIMQYNENYKIFSFILTQCQNGGIISIVTRCQNI